MAAKHAKKAAKLEEEDAEEFPEGGDEDEGGDKQSFDPLAASLTSMEWLPRISVGKGLLSCVCSNFQKKCCSHGWQTPVLLCELNFFCD